MKSIPLFKEENEAWTDEANCLFNQITTALKPIFEEANKIGYRLRDLNYIADLAAEEVTLDLVLDKQGK